MNLEEFYKDKKVLITGHTGFKGSWLCSVLVRLGANVTGYSNNIPTEPSAHKLLEINDKVASVFGDIRDFDEILKVMQNVKPDIVFHLAAQPLVIDSYKDPVLTYDTNVMGTVHLLEAARNVESVHSIVVITTDKVYENKEWFWGYRESDVLNGFDPYSNSKSCAELVTSSYMKSFFAREGVAVSTCRAGNVIGGGDFAKDRIIPDCFRAITGNAELILRNPNATRPYQHVLEPICSYLEIGMKQYQNSSLAGQYNIGPLEEDCYTTESIVKKFYFYWETNMNYIVKNNGELHEAGMLKLDSSKIKAVFGIVPIWDLDTAIRMTTEWYKKYYEEVDIWVCTQNQIEAYLRDRYEKKLFERG